MKTKVSYLLLGLVVLLVGCSSQGIRFDDVNVAKPRVLILGQDQDEDSVPRSRREFQRFSAAAGDVLNTRGYLVYNETAIVPDGFTRDRTSRTDAELIEIVRSLPDAPVDVVVLLTLYASVNAAGYATKIRIHSTGRLLSIRTGQSLGDFESEEPSEWTVPSTCNRACIMEEVGSKAQILAESVGLTISEKLD